MPAFGTFQYLWRSDPADVGDYFGFPDNCRGSVTLHAPASEDPTPGGRPGLLFGMFPNAPNDDTFTLLSTEDPRDARTNAGMLDILEAKLGRRPQGDTLLDCLVDQMTVGSDPLGETACRTLGPGHDGYTRLAFANRIIWQERFVWGQSASTAKVLAWLKAELSRVRQESIEGRRRDVAGRVDLDSFRRVADWYLEKFAGRNPQKKAQLWELLRPADWAAGETPLKHATTLQEPFTGGASDTLGPNFSWTELGGGDMDLNGSGLAVCATAAVRCRCDSDLSGSDHYSQAVMQNRGGNMEVDARIDSGADTMYRYLQSSSQARIFREATGSQFQVGSSVSQAWLASGYTQRIEVSGSATITGWMNGTQYISVTDGNIGGNTRCGFGASGTTGQTFDDWEAGDLSVGGQPTMRRLGLLPKFRMTEIGREGVNLI